MRSLLASLLVGSFLLLSSCTTPSDDVAYFGPSSWSISTAVQIPPDRTMFWTSGTIPPAVDTSLARSNPARYGDMETQATGVLGRIRDTLSTHGMTLDDVVYLRVYLAPDSTGAVDTEGWSDAYGQFFGTEDTPTKPARSTVAVHQLVNPAWRVEIEAFAVMP